MNITGLDENSFEFKWKGKEISGSASEIVAHGKIEFDYERNKFKAFGINGGDRVVVYDDDSAVAAAKAVLKWLL